MTKACTHKSGRMIPPVDVCFAQKATELLRGSEMTRWANSRHQSNTSSERASRVGGHVGVLSR